MGPSSWGPNVGRTTRGPYLGGRAPRSPSLGARQAPRNFRGQNIENEKICDISTPAPADSEERLALNC